ncbi:GntR family transcriptional regulator [Actinoplanes subtropicus]|uniref:GntR family transcriptional regulator n=1 Tax=Actinoplanes subtropicus TaxID=543632 RepID=UPI0005589D12|nr:GntR family transcriptional regulator [Actinoplanes subtropicus]
MTTSTVSGEAPSFAERAYETIRDRLVMLEIRPGAPINDDQLGRELGLGRTPVREALKRLERERLVVAYPRRGTFATDVKIADLGHISEVRQQLEPVAAAAAARRATPADRADLRSLAARLRAAGGTTVSTELMRLDMTVHRAIYAATHNPYLEDTLVHYDNLATRVWCLFLNRLTDLAGHVGEHSELLGAIADGDADRAAELAAAHVADFERAIRAVL